MRNAYFVELRTNEANGSHERLWGQPCVMRIFRFISLHIHSMKRKVSV